jgi:hypothetical protein
MQGQGLPVDQDAAARKDPWDDPDTPIGTSRTTSDDLDDPPADGVPPYDGPPGGGGNHGSK